MTRTRGFRCRVSKRSTSTSETLCQKSQGPAYPKKGRFGQDDFKQTLGGVGVPKLHQPVCPQRRQSITFDCSDDEKFHVAKMVAQDLPSALQFLSAVGAAGLGHARFSSVLHALEDEGHHDVANCTSTQLSHDNPKGVVRGRPHTCPPARLHAPMHACTRLWA